MAKTLLEECLFIRNAMSEILKGDDRMFTGYTGTNLVKRVGIPVYLRAMAIPKIPMFRRRALDNLTLVVDNFRAPVAKDAAVVDVSAA